jgi:hypothetical protein
MVLIFIWHVNFHYFLNFNLIHCNILVMNRSVKMKFFYYWSLLKLNFNFLIIKIKIINN